MIGGLNPFKKLSRNLPRIENYFKERKLICHFFGFLSLLVFLICPVGWPIGGAQQPSNLDQNILKLDGGDEAFTEPIEEIKVAAADMGIVAKIHVNLGDTVSPHDLLVELDQSVLEATRQIAESKANNKARIKAAEVEYQIKQARYEKLVQLVRDGAGSPEEVERAKADAEVAQQEIQALREQAEQYRLEVRQYEAQIEQRRIRSPIRGQVVEIRKKVGEFVSANDPHLVSVVQIDTLRAIFFVPTQKAMQLQKEETVEVLFEETNQRTRAKVEFVAPITQADSGRVRVDVLIDNRTGEFRSGVRCRLVDPTIRPATQVNYRRTN